jgi:hypothetical protein
VGGPQDDRGGTVKRRLALRPLLLGAGVLALLELAELGLLLFVASLPPAPGVT